MKNILRTLALASVVFVSACSHAPVGKAADLKPTVILVSIDGFRADYLEKLSVPNLAGLARSAARAKSLIPVFPSVTFPNHFSIVTGLYPEHHGIMLNEFIDPTMPEPFTHKGHAPAVTDARWWQGEPIWVTAEKQGQRSASAFWPSSASVIQGRKPTYQRSFEEDGAPEERVEQVLKWLDLPSEERPTMLTLYFENVDNAGHRSGPDSEDVKVAAAKVDQAIGSLLAGLKARGIESQVNLVIVSDHGMSGVDQDKVVDLNKIAGPGRISEITGEGAIVGVYPKAGETNKVFNLLKSAHAPMRVYRGDQVPAALHFTKANRTPPILCVGNERAFILGKDGKVQGGTHGYDPQLQSMNGIFLAHGPAFKTAYERPAFRNIHIYSLIADVLRLTPTTNDGSLDEVRDLLR